jgi:hypothetical protein
VEAGMDKFICLVLDGRHNLRIAVPHVIDSYSASEIDKLSPISVNQTSFKKISVLIVMVMFAGYNFRFQQYN